MCAPGAITGVGELRGEAQIRFERGPREMAGALDLAVGHGVLLRRRARRAATRGARRQSGGRREAGRCRWVCRCCVDADLPASQGFRRFRGGPRLADRGARVAQACWHERAQTRVEDLHRHFELLLQHVEQGPRRLGKVERLGHLRHGRSASHAHLRA